MRHQLSVCILVLACLTIACVGDDSSTGATLTDGSSGSTTKSTTGVGTTSEGTTGVGTTGEVPPEACVEPPSPPPALPVPLFDETSSTETIVLDLLDSRCPKTFGLFPDLVPNFLRARFYLPWEMGGLPLGLFPLVVFTHGNSQAGDKYPEILEPLARNGAVFRDGPSLTVTMALIWGAFVGVMKAEHCGYIEVTDSDIADARDACWRAFATDDWRHHQLSTLSDSSQEKSP